MGHLLHNRTTNAASHSVPLLAIGFFSLIQTALKNSYTEKNQDLITRLTIYQTASLYLSFSKWLEHFEVTLNIAEKTAVRCGWKELESLYWKNLQKFTEIANGLDYKEIFFNCCSKLELNLWLIELVNCGFFFLT